MELLENTRADIEKLLPRRQRDCHKGDFGRALLMAGSERYAGAALLGAAAALRAGTGVLYACVPRAIRAAFFSLPEVICIGVGTGGSWDEAALHEAAREIPNKQACAIGSGMGEMERASLLMALLETGRPLVIDADGLNFLAKRPELLPALHENVVLTPHALEFSRLSGTPLEQIKQDPAENAARFARDWGCTVLLKGAESCIARGEVCYLNRSGNPGLAKGGSGDVLTGLILALLSQGLSPVDAARAGAYLLGASADTAFSLLHNRMLTARDVIEAAEMTLRGFGS